VSNTIPPSRPPQLAPAELRQLAAATVRNVVPDVPVRAASLAVDGIDAAVWGLLGSLGLTPQQAAVVAAGLWGAP
jgi:hypothetical protein